MCWHQDTICFLAEPANVEPPHPGPPAQHAVLAKTATLLGITGTLQAQQEVVHLVADCLWKPRVGYAPASSPSLDFQ